MAQRTKQIQIGVIRSEQEAKEAVLKIKDILTKTLEEVKRVNGAETATRPLTDQVVQLVNYVLDKAIDATKTERAKEAFAQIKKETGYSEKQIQVFLDTLKQSFNQLV